MGVDNLVKGLPAEKLGVRVGDVLVEVQGVPVDSSSWFRLFSQATPPFGLKFRRPKSSGGPNAQGIRPPQGSPDPLNNRMGLSKTFHQESRRRFTSAFDQYAAKKNRE